MNHIAFDSAKLTMTGAPSLSQPKLGTKKGYGTFLLLSPYHVAYHVSPQPSTPFTTNNFRYRYSLMP